MGLCCHSSTKITSSNKLNKAGYSLLGEHSGSQDQSLAKENASEMRDGQMSLMNGAVKFAQK